MKKTIFNFQFSAIHVKLDSEGFALSEALTKLRLFSNFRWVAQFSTFSLIFLLFISSCSSSFFTEKKTNIIEKDTFILVLADMHLADILLVRKKKFDRKLKDTTGKISYYNTLFKKHKVNEYRFLKTVEFYAENTLEYSEIYKEVVDELSERRAEIINLVDSLENMEKDKFEEELSEIDTISVKDSIEKLRLDSSNEKNNKDSLRKPDNRKFNPNKLKKAREKKRIEKE